MTLDEVLEQRAVALKLRVLSSEFLREADELEDSADLMEEQIRYIKQNPDCIEQIPD